MNSVPITIIKDFQKLILEDRFDDALKLSTQLIIDYPDDHKSYAVHGISNLQLYEFDEALKSIETSKDLGCSRKDFFTNMAAFNTKKGNYYYNKSDFDNSLIFFLKAIKFPSVNLASNYSNLGNCYSKLNKLNKAEASYKKSVNINPKLPANHINLANHYLHISDYISAEKHARIAFDLDPIQHFYARTLAESLVFQNKLDEALSIYKKLIMNDGLNLISYIDVSKTLYELKKYDELIIFLEKNKEIANKSSTLLHLLGLGHFRTGNSSDAINYILNAILIDSKDINIYKNLVLIYESIGDKDNINKFNSIIERLSSNIDN
jgi:tetratricopeptide (TPR) repeat protein